MTNIQLVHLYHYFALATVNHLLYISSNTLAKNLNAFLVCIFSLKYCRFYYAIIFFVNIFWIYNSTYTLSKIVVLLSLQTNINSTLFLSKYLKTKLKSTASIPSFVEKKDKYISMDSARIFLILAFLTKLFPIIFDFKIRFHRLVVFNRNRY